MPMYYSTDSQIYSTEGAQEAFKAGIATKILKPLRNSDKAPRYKILTRKHLNSQPQPQKPYPYALKKTPETPISLN